LYCKYRLLNFQVFICNASKAFGIIFLTFFFIVIIVQKGICQKSIPNIINAAKISSKINFDGNPEDSLWKSTLHISNFTQRELDFGKPGSEKTETAILYDKNNLYFAVWCYQKSNNPITAKYLHRDFDYFSDDNFKIFISSLNDHRNGYLFVINPNGARADMEISGSNVNQDWNGVWDAKTIRTSEGWFAEIVIPFNTLQFKKDSVQTWAVNFERDIQSLKEVDLWQGWSRDYDITNFVSAGILSGIKNIGYSRNFELKPYGLAGFQNETGTNTIYPAKIGGDLNVNLSPTLKLNLTVNADFAQVEADQIPVNLTRFNVLYPEKREFFLEGYNYFQFGLGNSSYLFYTRQIGFEQLSPVPVIGGARLFGKIGNSNIGLLNLETGSKDSIPATNNTVVRYKYDIGSQSYIGGIMTSHINSLGANQVLGIDGQYATSTFLKDKNLSLSGLIAGSIDNYKIRYNSLSYKAGYSYLNDLISSYASISSIQQNFDPALGFLYRSDYTSINGYLDLEPRWFSKYGVQKLDISPTTFSYFITQNTGKLESWNNLTRPFGVYLKDGGGFLFDLYQSYDRLDIPFVLAPNAMIPVGQYYMHNTEFLFSTSTNKKVWVQAGYNWGTYYGGTIQTISLSGSINLSKHFNMNADYSYNYIQLPSAKITVNELAPFINYAFNTRLDLSLFAQWNTLNNIMQCNFRIHWIPTIGTDLYAVYDMGYNSLNNLDYLKPQTSEGVFKLIWRFVF